MYVCLFFALLGILRFEFDSQEDMQNLGYIWSIFVGVFKLGVTGNIWIHPEPIPEDTQYQKIPTGKYFYKAYTGVRFLSFSKYT